MLGHLNILQVNLNRSRAATESTLEVAILHKVDLVLVQEPYFLRQDSQDYTTCRSIQHPSFQQILEVPQKTQRPRTLAYLAKNCPWQINSSDTTDSDLLALTLTGPGASFSIYNLYNEKGLLEDKRPSTQRCLFQTPIKQPALVLGDFNTHHPWWDPTYSQSPTKQAEELVTWLEDQELELVNSIGQGTFWRPNMSSPSVLDLTFASKACVDKIHSWKTIPEIGSDHSGLLFQYQYQQVHTEHTWPRLNTKKADWEKFSQHLSLALQQDPFLQSQDFQALERAAQEGDTGSDFSTSVLLGTDCLGTKETTPALERAASALTAVIQKAAIQAIPEATLSSRSKPWWSVKLTDLRKALKDKQRQLGRDPSVIQKRQCCTARNVYLQAIKAAKRDHWNQFLTKEDPRNVYKAMAYTKDFQRSQIPTVLGQTQFQDKCNALRGTLFPTPPQTTAKDWSTYQPKPWSWPLLQTCEIEAALRGAQGKAPGPDRLTLDIIQRAYSTVPQVFKTVLGALFNLGYHPLCWKEATGVVLRKPGKPDYSIPKAYRVISLLNCLGKINERIMAKRLGYLAETSTLIHPSQIGCRRGKSAEDALLLFTQMVQENKRHNKITSTLFLDVKGAFDHVAKNQLLKAMAKQHLPWAVLSWTSSFLSDRELKLSFNNQTEASSPVNTGIPQGSPVSPILFLIYISSLFRSKNIQPWSFADDISLSTASTSIKKNVRILERETASLYQTAKEHAIEFDLDKTELIHFASSKAARTISVLLPDKKTVTPKQTVKWLGMLLDHKLSYKTHVNTQMAKAKSAFMRMSRLANVNNGLAPAAVKQIYTACVRSIADYAAQVWWKRGKSSLTKHYQMLQNQAQRKILGAFKTSPVYAMEIETGIPPVENHLNWVSCRAALRMHKMPESHPLKRKIEEIQLQRQEQALDSDPGSSLRHSLPRKQTQLEYLTECLPALQEPLEPFQGLYFPPWCLDVPFSTVILKEEEAIQNHDKIAPRGTAIYVDASEMAGKSYGIGVGLAVYTEWNQEPEKQATNTGTQILVYNGELEAIATAFEAILKLSPPPVEVNIFSDCQSAIQRISSPSDIPGQSCQIRALNAAKAAQDQGTQIYLHWIPSHTGKTPGNDLADDLAKEGSMLPPVSGHTSWTFWRSRARQAVRREWRLQTLKRETFYKETFGWKGKKRLDIPENTARKTASAYYQLKLGHGYFRAYLRRFGIIQSSECQCGHRTQDPHHLLLCCKLYHQQRKRVRREIEGPLTLEALLGTKKGIRLTMQFLKVTGISTRDWYYAGQDEGGEWGEKEEEEVGEGVEEGVEEEVREGEEEEVGEG